MRLRTFIHYTMLVALMTAWSAGFGQVLYQSCCAGCCSPRLDHTSCSDARGQPANVTLEVSKDGVQTSTDSCGCNSTCDNACSECVYFHAGVIENSIPLMRTAFTSIFNPPPQSLQFHSSEHFRPPQLGLA